MDWDVAKKPESRLTRIFRLLRERKQWKWNNRFLIWFVFLTIFGPLLCKKAGAYMPQATNIYAVLVLVSTVVYFTFLFRGVHRAMHAEQRGK